MATYFNVDEKEMLTLWLADKILSDLEGEDELKLTFLEMYTFALASAPRRGR